MSDMNYSRCPNDDRRVRQVRVGKHPDTGQSVELNMNGISTVVSIWSAMCTLTATMKAGHEEDFLEKVALTLFGHLTQDPHALCPLLRVLSMCLLMLQETASITFDKEGHLTIAVPDGPLGGSKDMCSYNLNEESSDGPDGGPTDGGTTEDAEGGGGINPT
jgi:hypothetical protein